MCLGKKEHSAASCGYTGKCAALGLMKKSTNAGNITRIILQNCAVNISYGCDIWALLLCLQDTAALDAMEIKWQWTKELIKHTLRCSSDV